MSVLRNIAPSSPPESESTIAPSLSDWSFASSITTHISILYFTNTHHVGPGSTVGNEAFFLSRNTVYMTKHTVTIGQLCVCVCETDSSTMQSQAWSVTPEYHWPHEFSHEQRMKTLIFMKKRHCDRTAESWTIPSLEAFREFTFSNTTHLYVKRNNLLCCRRQTLAL